MKILAIDSSGLTASVAIVSDHQIIAEYTVNYKKTHSQTLLPLIDSMMAMIDMKPEELDAIAVSIGPGSFTGLRIGIALAKGLGLALNIPVVGVSTIESLAYNMYGNSHIVCPIMDARRNQVYTGIFTFEETGFYPKMYGLKTIIEPTPMDMDELLQKINSIGREVVFVGDGIPVYRELISERIGVPYEFANSANDKQRASSVGLMGEKLLNEGKGENAADVKPVYLRMSQAERELAEKNGEA